MSNKPKILFIGPLPPPLSGPELSMQQFLMSKVLNTSFEIDLLKTNFRSDNTKKGKLDLLMLINFFNFFFNFFKLLLKDKYACVYYPITPTQIGWLGRDVWTILLAKIFRAKVIIHLRGSHFKLNFEQFNWFAKKIIGFTLRQVDKAIVQAHYLNDQFAPFIEHSNVEVLYQAMDTNEFPLSNIRDIKKGNILVVGHLTKAKGYTDILKIMPEIIEEFPYVKFKFAGNLRKGERGVFFNQFTGEKIEYEDPIEAEKKITTKLFKNNYQNLGIIQGKDKLKQLQKADIFLSASYSEGFSRALLEAMSVGKPIIYTPVGAHREVFNNLNGESFSPGNLEQLKISLRKMLKKEDRRKVGEYNRNYVLTNFSIDKISEDFESIISKTIET